MSFDNYVHHMTHKYRLAVAIAVLKNKPANSSIEQYMTVLKNKMAEAIDTDELDITICSDDFKFDDDDMIDKVFNDDDIRLNIEDGVNSMTVLNDFDGNIKSKEIGDPRSDNLESNSFAEVFKMLRDVDETEVEKAKVNTPEFNDSTQTIHYEKSQCLNNPVTSKANNIPIGEEIGIYNAPYENISHLGDTGPLYDERIVANILKSINNNTSANNKNINIEERDQVYIENVTIRPQSITQHFEEIVSFSDSKTLATKIYDKLTKEVTTANKVAETLGNEKECFNISNEKVAGTYVNLYVEPNYNGDRHDTSIMYNLEETHNSLKDQNYNIANKIYRNLLINENNNMDSQATMLYSLHGFTQNYSHISQSQYDNINVAKKYITGNKDKYVNNVDNDPNECNFANIETKNTTLDNTDIEINVSNLRNDATLVPKILEVNADKIEYIIDKNGKTYRILDGNYNITQSAKINNDIDETNTVTEGDLTKDDSYSQLEDKIEDLVEEQSASVVPFKVIEELNKVKVFLSRRHDRRASVDGYSTDSGYRSDTQSKSSYKGALQLSDNWLNQSAHCLYDYVANCPLVGTTQEIVNEISVIIGRLIDKLHDEEKYPPFLDEIFDNIDLLLNDLYEGENSIDNVLLIKDEIMQRLFLLNKSFHILKYSIEKVTDMLERAHTQLKSEENLYELTNIDETENLCYIFHLLETFIKRYIKTKDIYTSSQCSLNSQDDGILKRSSITDIWKKKWNPDYKKCGNEGTSGKRCALTKCGETLNRMIVECIDGYSLIAFSALQCFNLLQKQ